MKQFIKLAPMVILLIFIMLSCSSVEEVTYSIRFFLSSATRNVSAAKT